MRLRTFTFLLPAILLTGCRDFTDFDLKISIPVSLHPLAGEDDITFDETLLGPWQGPEGVGVVFEEGSDSDTYRIEFFDDSTKVASLQATLTDVEGTRFVDMVPPGPDPNTLEMNQYFYLPTHLFVKITLAEPNLSMHLALFDSILEDDPNALPHEIVSQSDHTYTVITASTEQLRRFMTEHAQDEDLFHEMFELCRYEAAPAEDPNIASCPNDLAEEPIKDK
jgi:hypothetical protein